MIAVAQSASSIHKLNVWNLILVIFVKLTHKLTDVLIAESRLRSASGLL